MIYLGLHSKWQNWDLKSINSNLNQYTVPPPRFLLGRMNTWSLSHDKWVAKAYLQPGIIPKSSSTAWLSPASPHYLLLCSLKGLWEIIKVHLHRGLGVPQKYHMIWRHTPPPPPPSNPILVLVHEAVSQPLLAKLFKASFHLRLHPLLQTIL